MRLTIWGLALAVVLAGCGGDLRQPPSPPDTVLVEVRFPPDTVTDTLRFEVPGPLRVDTVEVEIPGPVVFDTAWDTLTAREPCNCDTVAVPPLDTVPVPPIDTVTPPPSDSLTPGCRAAVTRENGYYNRLGAPWPHCAGEYPDREGEAPPDSVEVPPVDTVTPPPVDTTPAPPTAGACGNDPAGSNGWTRFTRQDFDQALPVGAGSVPGGWSVRKNGAHRMSIAGGMAVGTHDTGLGGGGAPYSVSYTFPQDVTALYACMMTRVDPWSDGGNVGTKWTFFRDARTTTGMIKTNHYFNLSKSIGFQLQSTGATLNHNYLTGRHVGDGQWHVVEYLADQATGDGTIWIDGVQIFSRSDILWTTTGFSGLWDGWSWEPTYGGGLNSPPRDLHIAMDYIVLSGR